MVFLFHVTAKNNTLLICLVLGVVRLVSFHIQLSHSNSKGDSSRGIPGAPTELSCNTEKTEKPGIDELPILMPFDRSRMGKRGYLRKENLFIHKANFLRYHSSTVFKSRNFAANATEIWSKYAWDRCALVGNSGSLLSADFGKEINEHDIVIRFNQAPTKGFEKFVGNRTTFRVLNALWTNIYAKNVKLNKDGSLDSRVNIRLGEIRSIPLEMDATLIISRTSVENFNFVYSALQKKRMDVRLLLLAPRVVTAAKWLLNQYRRLLCTHGYGPYTGGHTPSSGFVAIFVLLQLCKDIDLYGFGDSGLSARYHYYTGGGHRNSGNIVHSWVLEMEMIEALHRNDLLKIH